MYLCMYIYIVCIDWFLSSMDINIMCLSPFSLSNSTLENIPGQYTFIHLSAVCFLNFEKTKVLSSDL